MLEEIAKLTGATAGPIVGAAGTEEEGRRAVREIADRGIRFAKIWVDDRGGSQEKLRPAIYRAIVDEADAHDIAVHAHQQSARDMNDLLRAGVAGFLHGRFGPAMDDELASRMKERGAFLVPNQGLGERRAWRVFDDPFFAETVPPEVVERLREAHDEDGPAPAGRPEVRAAFQRLLSADVPIALGTDAGAVPDHFFGYSGHRELEIYTRMGMTPMQAIVAATGRPAEHLGLTETGTVAPGRSADFVVLDANPLEDIRNTRAISKVYLRGEEIDRDALRAGWTDS